MKIKHLLYGALLSALTFSCSGGGGGKQAVPQKATLKLAPATAPAGEVGQAYSLQITASGGTSPYHFSLSKGSLPGGLVLGADTGLLSGTPTKAGAYKLTVSCEDSSAPSLKADLSLDLVIKGELKFSGGQPPIGKVGKPYSFQVKVSGGNAPYFFKLSKGILPDGLLLDAKTGLFSGTPAKAQTSKITLLCNDSTTPALAATLDLEFTIKKDLGSLTLSPLTWKAAHRQWCYYEKITGQGGTAPYNYNLAKGSTLPFGLTLDSGTGEIQGIPAKEGNYTIQILVTDSSAKQKFGIVDCKLAIEKPMSSDDPKSKKFNLFFIHHSVGWNLFYRGGKEGLAYILYAHNYLPLTMTYGDANVKGYVIGDHTDVPDWPTNFNTSAYYATMATWKLKSGIHDIMMFKSCYPNSGIKSEKMLSDYKAYYRSLLPTFKANPHILYVPFSTPPLNPASTNKDDAARARRFAQWLKYEYSAQLINVISFDFFNILANDPSHSTEPNMLKKEYRSGTDSHPTAAGDKAVIAEFMPFINRALRAAGLEN